MPDALQQRLPRLPDRLILVHHEDFIEERRDRRNEFFERVEELVNRALWPDRLMRGFIGPVQRLRVLIAVIRHVQRQRLFDVAHDAHTARVTVQHWRPIGPGNPPG